MIDKYLDVSYAVLLLYFRIAKKFKNTENCVCSLIQERTRELGVFIIKIEREIFTDMQKHKIDWV